MQTLELLSARHFASQTPLACTGSIIQNALRELMTATGDSPQLAELVVVIDFGANSLYQLAEQLQRSDGEKAKSLQQNMEAQRSTIEQLVSCQLQLQSAETSRNDLVERVVECQQLTQTLMAERLQLLQIVAKLKQLNDYFRQQIEMGGQKIANLNSRHEEEEQEGAMFLALNEQLAAVNERMIQSSRLLNQSNRALTARAEFSQQLAGEMAEVLGGRGKKLAELQEEFREKVGPAQFGLIEQCFPR